MNTIFFGTPPFAANVLSYLIDNGVKISAVVSRPDKPKGRSSKLVPTPVKVVSENLGLDVHQPVKASSSDFANVLRSYQPDLFVVVAYGEIISQQILDIPTKACINLHASLLPELRGAAPIQWAIINGLSKTGITIMHMVKKMDAGNIIMQAECPILQDETYGELEDKLCDIGSLTLLKVIHQFERGTPSEKKQDESLVTMAPKIELEDCHINWKMPAQKNHNLIRGVNPFPGAWTEAFVRGEKIRIKIFRSKMTDSASESPGRAICVDKKLLVGCGDKYLQVVELQPASKRKMLASDWLQGVDISQLVFNT